MKNAFLLALLLFLVNGLLAQPPQKWSYQSVIRNASDQLVSNAAVGIQISILQGSSAGTPVYEEVHAPTTNTNGLASLEIGGGTILTGTFETIDWAAGPYFVKSEVDPDGGTSYSLTLTSELLSVPYALYALTSADSHMNIPTGLEAIDEGAGIGWRLIGRNPDNYGAIGENAVDLSTSVAISSGMFQYGALGPYSTAFGSQTEASGTYAFAAGRYAEALGNFSTAFGSSTEASGESSTALGYFTIASGIRSIAMGTITEASGNYSTVMGQNTIASGLTSTAMGRDTEASGVYSTAMGRVATASGSHSIAMGSFVSAPSYSETAMGSYNTTYTPLSTSEWNDNDRLFVIGNGQSVFTRSNALTVLKNGNIGIGDETPDAALDVVGNIHYTGTITDVSDRRLKENLKKIENPLENLNAIQGYSYSMIDDSEKQREYGVIAQDVQKVFPDMVRIIDQENGYLGVSYIQLIPVLLEAIKVQQEMIDGQETAIKELRQKCTDQAEALDANSAMMKELHEILSQQTMR